MWFGFVELVRPHSFAALLDCRTSPWHAILHLVLYSGFRRTLFLSLVVDLSMGVPQMPMLRWALRSTVVLWRLMPALTAMRPCAGVFGLSLCVALTRGLATQLIMTILKPSCMPWWFVYRCGVLRPGTLAHCCVPVVTPNRPLAWWQPALRNSTGCFVLAHATPIASIVAGT